jgi:hypothetical protein
MNNPETLASLATRHRTKTNKTKQLKNHKIRSLVQQLFCETCSAQGSDIIAVFYCLDCEEPEPYCELCAEQHTSMKKSKSHKMYHICKYMLEKTEGAIENEQSRDISIIGHKTQNEDK